MNRVTRNSWVVVGICATVLALYFAWLAIQYAQLQHDKYVCMHTNYDQMSRADLVYCLNQWGQK